jgi:hypothetical protein
MTGDEERLALRLRIGPPVVPRGLAWKVEGPANDTTSR